MKAIDHQSAKCGEVAQQLMSAGPGLILSCWTQVLISFC